MVHLYKSGVLKLPRGVSYFLPSSLTVICIKTVTANQTRLVNSEIFLDKQQLNGMIFTKIVVKVELYRFCTKHL